MCAVWFVKQEQTMGRELGCMSSVGVLLLGSASFNAFGCCFDGPLNPDFAAFSCQWMR